MIETNLGSLCKEQGRYGIGAPAVDFDPNLPTYLRITDIRDDGTLYLKSLKSVADSKASEYLLKENDIVFARTGNSTGRNYFYDPRDGDFVFAGFLIKFSIDEDLVNPRYIKYYTQSTFYWSWIESIKTGSTRDNINAKTYAEMPILLPSRELQNAIVFTLDSISEKLRINNRINDYLAA